MKAKIYFSLEKRKNHLVTEWLSCQCDGETFSIWKAFEGEVMFSDIVFWGMDYHLGVSGKCFCRDILRRTLEKGVLKIHLETEYHSWTPVSSLLVCVCMLSHFRRTWFFATPWTGACQAPLNMEFSRQEYWSGFWCPPPGGFPDPGTESASLKSPALTGRFSTTPATWKASLLLLLSCFSCVWLCATP